VRKAKLFRFSVGTKNAKLYRIRLFFDHSTEFRDDIPFRKNEIFSRRIRSFQSHFFLSCLKAFDCGYPQRITIRKPSKDIECGFHCGSFHTLPVLYASAVPRRQQKCFLNKIN